MFNGPLFLNFLNSVVTIQNSCPTFLIAILRADVIFTKFALLLLMIQGFSCTIFLKYFPLFCDQQTYKTVGLQLMQDDLKALKCVFLIHTAPTVKCLFVQSFFLIQQAELNMDWDPFKQENYFLNPTTIAIYLK